MRQEGILLGLVETMDLVDEDDRSRAVLFGPFGIGHNLLDFLDSSQHRGELNELRLGHARDDFGKSRLASAWRSPEDDGASVIALD